MRIYLALLKSNIVLTLRDRALLFFNYAFPLLFFFVFAGLFSSARGAGIGYFVGTVLTMGVLGNGLWGAGMRAVQEREAGILRRFKVTPISPAPILVASMAGGWLLYMPVLILLIALAHFCYGMPLPENWFSLFLMASLGVCAFRAIGLILAAVTNTVQEATVLIQLFYFPMLLLSGATVPAASLPKWIQTVAEFMPASYLVAGFQGIFFRNERISDHATEVCALLFTLAVGMFLSFMLFRWDKEEKIRPRNRVWIVAVMAPFLIIGGYRAYSKDHLSRNESFMRAMQRSDTFLIRNTRIFVGDGRVIENGSVLVRNGRIAQVYEGAALPAADTETIIDGAGKTLLPGLIDAHVHLAAIPGVSTDAPASSAAEVMGRAAAALLYGGVTAARSVGDSVPEAVRLRTVIARGGGLGAEIFVWSPVFTAQPWLGTEFLDLIPAPSKDTVRRTAVRVPKTPEEARAQVRAALHDGVNGLKAILQADAGDGNRIDLLLARSVAEEGNLRGLPLATHTRDSRDVADAVEIGSASVEHGSWRDEMPESLLERMARNGVSYDPTLSAAESCVQYYSGDDSPLKSAMFQQVLQPALLSGTRTLLASGKTRDQARAMQCQYSLMEASDNLVRAWKAGVPLVVGTDSGDPLVPHGASMHHELMLWVHAGIPPSVALQAATSNAARLLRAPNRLGAIRPGFDADLLLVEGNPLVDIGATERISLVVFKGERIRRSDLLDRIK
jgi:imidazolonepropionase-like amidohydrolase/ABC-type multidrug transport system permease subunit